MKVTTDSCLFGAWCASEIQRLKDERLNLLDVGAGSGLLSLMIAQKLNLKIDAVEIDSDTVHQARENVGESPWKDRIEIINADVQKWIPAKRYDAIIANPPFYEGDLKSGSEAKNIAHHDKGLKLEGLLHFIKTSLTKNGVFFLLLPFTRLDALQKLLTGLDLHLHKLVIVKQTTTHSPFRIMVQGSNRKMEMLTEEISIKNDQQQYTEKFMSLLKEYYLYL